MSDEIRDGVIRPPQPTGDAAVLAAFREVTGWTDEDVLHWATCWECDPLGGDYEYYCANSPKRRREREQRDARPSSESTMDHAVSVLAAALRRTATDAARAAREQAPLSTGAIRSGAVWRYTP